MAYGPLLASGGRWAYVDAMNAVAARLARHRISRRAFARDLGVSEPELSRWLSGRRVMLAPAFLELERGSRAFVRRVLEERRDAAR